MFGITASNTMYEESLEVAKRDNWEKEYINKHIPTGKLTIKTLDDWVVAKAAKELTGKQFAQYCKDYNICIKG